MDQAVAFYFTEEIPAGTLALEPPATKFLPESVFANELPGDGVMLAKVALSEGSCGREPAIGLRFFCWLGLTRGHTGQSPPSQALVLFSLLRFHPQAVR